MGIGRPRSVVPVGRRFHRLVVLGAKHVALKRSQWICRCDCGKKTNIFRTLLLGLQKSCGCGRVKHGAVGTPEYTLWMSMKNRCRLHPGYKARGIKVCRRWDRSFAAFLADMGPRPGPRMTLDRINTRRGYTPKNTRWATWHQQSRNKINNRYITFEGHRRVAADWGRRIGVTSAAIILRLDNLGRPLRRALTEPSHWAGVTAFGKTLTIARWAQRTGIRKGTIANRIRHGWPVEQALTAAPSFQSRASGRRS